MQSVDEVGQVIRVAGLQPRFPQEKFRSLLPILELSPIVHLRGARARIPSGLLGGQEMLRMVYHLHIAFGHVAKRPLVGPPPLWHALGDFSPAIIPTIGAALHEQDHRRHDQCHGACNGSHQPARHGAERGHRHGQHQQ